MKKPVLSALFLSLAISMAGAAGLEEPPVYDQPAKATVAPTPVSLPFTPAPGETIALIGNTLGERMQYFGHFETALQRRFPEAHITVRNMCNSADTPGLRPSPSRKTQWAFPGAEQFHPDKTTHYGIGHYPYPDEWLTEVKADTIIAFFGFNESFDGLEKRDNFKAELSAWIDHSLGLAYNGKTAPRIILVTPIAFEDRSDTYALPAGTEENKRLAAYANAVLEVAKTKKTGAVDVFAPTAKLYEMESAPLTINGCHLSDFGYQKLAPVLIDAIFGAGEPVSKANVARLREAVLDKEWIWNNDYRILNGVHAYGQRWKPYGNVNYPEEIEKLRQMGKLRDQRIWDVAAGLTELPPVADDTTRKLSPIETNFPKRPTYLGEEKAMKEFVLADGYKIELFASEKEFPMLGNPVQMTFDTRGRLWVSTVPSYPHYKPGGSRPDDKILILEDTDGDNRADKQTVFADKLHIPIGFELTHDGVFLSQEPNIMFLKDTDGDDVADERHIMVGGFDSHDTHHAISAYCADASGAFFLCEGRFLHSQVETPYGPQRMTDGGVWRFDPRSWRLERFSQSDYSNPWGVAFDEFGQNFISDASGGANFWALPLSANVPHGYEIEKEGEFTTHKVRPTSGTEFISSGHFPDEVQGDFLINNTIGFLGTKQHIVREDGAGFTGEIREDIVRSDDPNFRPCDLEFAPDGSLYIVDWHNALIGHMQHSAREPKRNSDYGRIYRVTYPGRPLVDPPLIHDAPLATLLENLKLHEYRARYRTRRELRGRDAKEVLPAVKTWAAALDKAYPNYGRTLLEALWVTWAQGNVDRDLLNQVLAHDDHRVRSAGVRVLRYAHAQIQDSTDLFLAAAVDAHPRVRLEAIVAASWLNNADGAKIALAALEKPIEKWMGHTFEAVMMTLKPHATPALATNDNAKQWLAGKIDYKPKVKAEKIEMLNVPKAALALYKLGEEVYKRDAHCITCHQPKGQGVPHIYPSLVKNEWVEGDPIRRIKIVLHGLWGPIEVNGETFSPDKGVPPMTAFGSFLSDEEIAGVLTYVSYNWKNSGQMITPEQVAKVRAETKDRTTFYMAEELLREHPFPE